MRGISSVGTGGYLMVLILGAFFGFVSGAYLADGIGRKRDLHDLRRRLVVLTIVYLFAPLSNDWILPVGFVLGYVSLIMFSPMGTFMTELYPTAVRGVGQGFCYNAGRGIGALFPALVGLPVGQARPWPGNRDIQPRRLRRYDRRSVPAAGNARPLARKSGATGRGVAAQNASVCNRVHLWAAFLMFLTKCD